MDEDLPKFPDGHEYDVPAAVVAFDVEIDSNGAVMFPNGISVTTVADGWMVRSNVCEGKSLPKVITKHEPGSINVDKYSWVMLRLPPGLYFQGKRIDLLPKQKHKKRFGHLDVCNGVPAGSTVPLGPRVAMFAFDGTAAKQNGKIKAQHFNLHVGGTVMAQDGSIRAFATTKKIDPDIQHPGGTKP